VAWSIKKKPFMDANKHNTSGSIEDCKWAAIKERETELNG